MTYNCEFYQIIDMVRVQHEPHLSISILTLNNNIFILILILGTGPEKPKSD